MKLLLLVDYTKTKDSCTVYIVHPGTNWLNRRVGTCRNLWTLLRHLCRLHPPTPLEYRDNVTRIPGCLQKMGNGVCKGILV